MRVSLRFDDHTSPIQKGADMNFRATVLIVTLSLCGAISPINATMMHPEKHAGTPEYNRELARSFVEDMLNTRQPNEFQRLGVKLVAQDYVQHNAMAASFGPGRDGLMKFIPSFLASFPDAKIVLHEVVADKQHVSARWTFSGTLTGAPFLGVPASGQHVQFDGFDLWTVRNGQLAEHWDAFDWVRLLTHLGATEVPTVFKQLAAPAGNGG